MIYRTLGRTGERVSAIGLGGYHMAVPQDEADGIKIVRTAIDRGINFWITAGTITTARVKSGWAKPCATATAKKSS